jgi:hypothetical protein
MLRLRRACVNPLLLVCGGRITEDDLAGFVAAGRIEASA